MKRRFLLPVVAAFAVVIGVSASSAEAGLLGGLFGGDPGCCEPAACEPACAPAPCEPACDPCCKKPCLLDRIRAKLACRKACCDPCCEPAACEPACCK